MATLNNQRVSQFEDQTYTLAISGSFAVPSIIHGWQRYGESFLVHPINPIAYHWICPTCVDPLIMEAGFPWGVFIDGGERMNHTNQRRLYQSWVNRPGWNTFLIIGWIRNQS